jgi:Integrase core domain
MDLFVVPTITFNLLYVLVIIRLARRELVWINVTAHPTAEWIAQQITEAFPWNEIPRYLIRDRDGIYGAAVTRRLRAMGIRDKPIAPGSPWQNPYVERLIGTIRRECLDHVIVFGEAHLRRILSRYAAYYNESRIHRSLDKDSPFHRAIERLGVITSKPVLGGLHHQYCSLVQQPGARTYAQWRGTMSSAWLSGRMRSLRNGTYEDTIEIRRRFKLNDAHVRRLLRLPYLAPDIIEVMGSAKTRHQKVASETRGQIDASVAQILTRRPRRIREMPRYRVVLRAFAGWPVETGLAGAAGFELPHSTSTRNC